MIGMKGTDIHGEDVEIRVVRQSDGTYRVWVDTAQGNVFRAYGVPALHLTGLTLADPADQAAAGYGKT